MLGVCGGGPPPVLPMAGVGAGGGMLRSDEDDDRQDDEEPANDVESACPLFERLELRPSADDEPPSFGLLISPSRSPKDPSLRNMPAIVANQTVLAPTCLLVEQG